MPTPVSFSPKPLLRLSKTKLNMVHLLSYALLASAMVGGSEAAKRQADATIRRLTRVLRLPQGTPR